MTMTTRKLLVLGGVLLFLLAMPALAGAAEPADARAAATCSDYSNQADAQRAADTRDPDGDGVYCESLPCPCLKPGQGSPRKRTPTRRPKAKPRKVAQVFAARVTAAVDGDTIKVRYRSTRTTVRIIGIDTPETKRPGVGVECGGPESSASMKRLAPVGARVTLRTDPTQDTRDRYRRLLAYVGRSGRDLGRTQISRGLAETYVYGGKPFQRTAAYRRSQAKANRLNSGVYGKCGGDFHSEQSTASASSAVTRPVALGAAFGFYRRCADTNFISDIAVKNMYCATAKRYIRNWYHRGKPMPGSFRCVLRSAPAKARCHNGRKVYSFRYAE